MQRYKHVWKRVPAAAALIFIGAMGLTGVACGTNARRRARPGRRK